MIDTALIEIRELLSHHLSNQFENSRDLLVLSNALNPDGSIPANLENKVVCCLLKVEEERSLKNNFNTRPATKTNSFRTDTGLNLNLHLIFYANFRAENYVEGVAYISAVIQFFHNNPIIKRGEPENLVKAPSFLFDMVQLDYNELAQLWGALGSKLMPSVFYKVRLIALEDNTVMQKIKGTIQPAVK